MAKIVILNPLTDTDLIINKLMLMKFKVDIDFISKENFDSMVKNGFDPEKWENKNNQNILIDGKQYTKI